MRTDFHNHLDEFATDLVKYCELDGQLLDKATHALLGGDIDTANEVIGAIDEVNRLRHTSERRAFDLLALEAPVAKDLRQVVSGIYAVEHLTRMAALVGHIAKVARRHHPSIAIPEPLAASVSEMARVDGELNDTLARVLTTQDVELALSLHGRDSAVDDIQRALMLQVTDADWTHGPTVAVDVALLARYYERFGDHTVSVANRIVYLVTGEKPEAMSDYSDTDDVSIFE